jgi:hypothetical protein
MLSLEGMEGVTGGVAGGVSMRLELGRGGVGARGLRNSR